MEDLKSVFSVPSAVMSGRNISIMNTYSHLIIINPENQNEFQCKLCLIKASYFDSMVPSYDGKDRLAQRQQWVNSLKAFHSCTSKSNIVTHIAIMHTEHLVPAHASTATYHKHIGPNDETPLGIEKMSNSHVNLDLTFWLLEDMLPFSIVEDSGFKKLVQSFAKVPSADTIAREAALVDEALQRFLRREIASNVGHSTIGEIGIPNDSPFTLLSFSADARTSVSGKPFLGLTVHYITDDFKMKSHVLALRHISPPNTFEAILDEYGFSTDTTLSVTTDSASVMQTMLDSSNLPHFRCITHCINVAVQQDTFDQANFKHLIDTPMKLAGYFSSVATHRNFLVEKKAKELGRHSELVKAVQVVGTRWNSIYDMLRAHLKRLVIIANLSGKALSIEPKAKEKEFDDVLEACIKLENTHIAIVKMLEPIAKWTTLFQSSALPTLSLIFEARSDILAHLSPDDDDPLIAKLFRAHLNRAITSRFNEHFVPINFPARVPESNPSYHDVENARTRWKMTNTAALLDIRTAYHHVKTEHMVEKDNITEILSYIATCVSTWISETNKGKKDETPSDDNYLDALLSTRKDTSHSSLVDVVREELRSYLLIARARCVKSLPGAPTVFKSIDERLELNPLEFWREMKGAFPQLAKVARSILAIQATSAVSERVFSSPEFTKNRHRSRLSLDSLEICTLVRDALKQNIDLGKIMGEVNAEKKEKAKRKRKESQTKRMELGSVSKKLKRNSNEVENVDDEDFIDLVVDEDTSTKLKIGRRVIEHLLDDDEDDEVTGL
jgi:hAT family C-terminal dimerisation region/Hermes transposase DNA-binding domain